MKKYFILILILLPNILLTGQINSGKVTKFELINKDRARVYFKINTKDKAIVNMDKKSISFLLNENKEPFDFTKTDKNAAVSTVLLVDASRSIKMNTFIKIEKTIRMIINTMGNQDELSIFSFNDFPMRLQNLTKDKNVLIRAIKRIGRAGQHSRLYNSVYRAVKYLDIKAANEKKAIIILSDGKEDGSTVDISRAWGIAVKNGIKVYSIGYSNSGNKDFKTLKVLSDKTNGIFSLENSNNAIKRIFKNNNTYKIAFNLKNAEKENVIKILYAKNLVLEHKFKLENSSAGKSQNKIEKNNSQAAKKQSKLSPLIYILLLSVIVIAFLITLYLIKRKNNKKNQERVINNEIEMLKIMEKEKEDPGYFCKKPDNNQKLNVKSVDIELGKPALVMEVEIEVELEKNKEKSKNNELISTF